jgi:hypothetical protein
MINPLRCVWQCGISLLFLLLSFSLATAETSPTFRSYLTVEANGGRPSTRPQTNFECSDTIYVVIEVTAPERQQTSEHLLVVDWFNPVNRPQEKTRFEFKSYGKGTRVWAWLRLSGSTGASIGQMFDPSFGMEDFIGKWRAEVRIDKKKIDTLPFDVLC